MTPSEIDASLSVSGFRFEPFPCLTFKVACSCSVTVVLWLGSVHILQWSLPSPGLKVSAFNFDTSHWHMLQLWYQSDGINGSIVLLREGHSQQASPMSASWPFPTSSVWRWQPPPSPLKPSKCILPISLPCCLTHVCSFYLSFSVFTENLPLEGWKTARVLGFLYGSVCKFKQPVCTETCFFVPTIARRVEAFVLSLCIHGYTNRTVSRCRNLKHQNSKFHWDLYFSHI